MKLKRAKARIGRKLAAKARQHRNPAIAEITPRGPLAPRRRQHPGGFHAKQRPQEGRTTE